MLVLYAAQHTDIFFFLLSSVNLPQVFHIGLMLHTVQWLCAQMSHESHHNYGCKCCSVQYQTGARLEQMASCIVHSPAFVHYGALVHERKVSALFTCLSELTNLHKSCIYCY